MPSPLRPEDIYRFRWIDHVRLSRSGEHVAYHLTWADAESRSNLSRVVVRRLLDPDPIEAAVGPRHDHSPEWSPDGRRIAFVSKRGAADQIFSIQLAVGDAVQLSAVPEGAGSPAWSPDGTHVAFIGKVVADPDSVVDDPRPPERKDETRRTPVARVARTLDYKYDGRGYADGRRYHVFVVSAEGGDATRLTSGPWSVEDFDWSPDGTRLVVIGNADPDADLHRESHVYSVDFSGGLEKIATGYDMSAPAWSPRGDLIAYVAQNGDEAGLLERLWVVPATGGEARCLTANLDLAVADSIVTDMRAGHGARIRWSRDGDRLYFLASGPGVTGLYSVDLEGNVRAEIGGQRRIFEFDVAGGVIAFCASEPSDPGELHVVMQGAEARLTDLNPWLRERYIAQPEQHTFTAPDGWVMQGWLLKPPEFDADRLHPLVMEVHGGPHAEYGWAFFHELQMLAGMGYLVFYLNPRGSDGYGEVFRKAVVRDWGGKDYVDLMSSLDQLIERTGAVDTSRMGVGGGSYGGFMTNWIIGHTNRFAAAVSMRSISNLVSEYAQHDIVLWGQLELGPAPWPDLDELWQRSPIRYVQEIKTPLLLTASEMDLRCAISQSEELFGALRLLGKTVELVRFPEEAHDLSRDGRPDRRVERLRRIAAWFDRYLGTYTSERGAVADAPAPPAAEPMEAEAPQEPAIAGVEAVAEAEVAPLPEMASVEAETQPATEAEAQQTGEPAPAAAVVTAPVIQAMPELPAPEVEAPAPEPAAYVVEALQAEEPAATEVLATVQPEPAPAAELAETVPLEPVPTEPVATEPAPAEATAPPEPAPLEAATIQVEYPQPIAAPAPAPAAPAWEEPAAGPTPPPAPTWDEAPAPGPIPTWAETAPAPEPVPLPTWAEPAAPAAPAEPAAPAAPVPTWDAAQEPQAPTAPPQAQPEPAPAAPPAAAPAAATVPPQLGSTIIAWPAPLGPSGQGEPVDGGGSEAATSIMPAWQPPQATASGETLALPTVTPEPSVGAEPPAKLTFETGPFAGRVVGIPDQSATVGRAPDNDIIIGDPATSGHHCRIEVRAGAYWISDLGSTNGTLLNGEPIIDKQVEHGDVISIGQNTVRFTLRS